MTHTGPRSTTQLALQRYALQAVEDKWTAAQLADAAKCSPGVAEKFLSGLARIGAENTKRNIIALADDYRSTLERTAARSREYLESISHLELEQLDKEQRALRKEALSSLTSLSSMLRLEVSASPDAPRQLGNL